MKASVRWSLIVILILSAAPIYTWFEGYTALMQFDLIKTFSATSRFSLGAIMIVTSSFGALLTSLVTALPAGYLAQRRPLLIASLLVISALAIPVYVLIQDPGGIRSFLKVVMTLQFVAVVVFFFFADCSWMSNLTQRQPDTIDIKTVKMPS